MTVAGEITRQRLLTVLVVAPLSQKSRASANPKPAVAEEAARVPPTVKLWSIFPTDWPTSDSSSIIPSRSEVKPATKPMIRIAATRMISAEITKPFSSFQSFVNIRLFSDHWVGFTATASSPFAMQPFKAIAVPRIGIGESPKDRKSFESRELRCFPQGMSDSTRLTISGD